MATKRTRTALSTVNLRLAVTTRTTLRPLHSGAALTRMWRGTTDDGRVVLVHAAQRRAGERSSRRTDWWHTVSIDGVPVADGRSFSTLERVRSVLAAAGVLATVGRRQP